MTEDKWLDKMTYDEWQKTKWLMTNDRRQNDLRWMTEAKWLKMNDTIQNDLRRMTEDKMTQYEWQKTKRLNEITVDEMTVDKMTEDMTVDRK